MRPMQRSVTAALFAVTALSTASCSDTDASGPAASPPEEVLTVAISPKLDTLRAGANRQLVARVSDARNVARDHALVWRSTDPAVASVTTAGVVTALAPGQSRIVASAGGGTDTATIVVLPAITSLSITPTAMQVAMGDTLLLSASVAGAAGVAASAGGIRWSSSDASVALVSPDGVVSTFATGDATITAELLGSTATAAVQVVRNSVASITITPANNAIYPGESQQLTAKLLDADGRPVTTPSLKWSTSDPAVATVSEVGHVTGIAKGLAVISAQAQGKRATATVNVLGVPVASVTVTLTASSLSVGQSAQATATLADANGNTLTGRVVAWQSSNPALATVTSSGIVTAVAKGSVTISAISDAKIGSAPLTVADAVPASVAIVPSSADVVAGQTAQLTAEVRDATGGIIPGQVVSWSSDDTATAPVAQTDVVTARAVGATVVRASTREGLTTAAPVAVSPVNAASLIVAPTTASVETGKAVQLSATARDASGNVLTDRVITWSSSAPSVATVSSTGLATGVSAGTATIIARVDEVSAASTLTVAAPPPQPVAAVAVTLATPTLSVGDKTQASATVTDASGNVLSGRSITWASANTEIATVSASGVVVAVSPGTASIVATSEGKSGAATLTVAAPPPAAVATVSLVASSTTLLVGETTQLTVTLKDAAGNVLTGRTIGWTSSNTSLATVSPSGLVTAVGAGGATITATSEGKSASITITITTSGGACRMVTGTQARAMGPLAKPGYLQSVVDPAFGTTLTRVSGDPGTAIPVVGGTWPQVAGSAYAKAPAWSADGAYLLLSVAGAVGGGVALVLDGASYRVVGKAGPAPSYAWHPTAPDVLIGVTGGGSVVTHNVRTGATATRVAVSGYSGGWLGKGEGNPSNDGRYVPVVARRAADGREVVYVADVAAGTKSADLDPAAQGFSDLDWAGVSQSGRYLFLFGTADGVWGRAKVYDRATLARVHYWTDYPTGHSDLGVDAAGNDVIFGVVGAAPYAHHFIARRLDTGAIADLTGAVVSYNWHATTRNTARPGWGYAATNDRLGYPLDGEVYAVKLDGSGLVERYAHHRAAVTDYDAHPFPVPAPDGKRVLFRSNWGAPGGRPVQAYVVDARPICP